MIVQHINKFSVYAIDGKVYVKLYAEFPSVDETGEPVNVSLSEPICIQLKTQDAAELADSIAECIEESNG